MIIARIETSLTFSNDTKPLTPAHMIYDTLAKGDKKPVPAKVDKPSEPGARIKDDERKMLLYWNYSTCQITFENAEDGIKTIAEIIKLLDRIDCVVPFKKLSKQIFTTFWVLPVKSEYTFKALETVYRDCFIKELPLWKNAFDSSILMTIKSGNRLLNHQSGTMDIAQLQTPTYSIFKRNEQFPKLFIFLSASIENLEVLEYSSGKMKDILENSFKECYSHASDFQNLLEAKL